MIRLIVSLILLTAVAIPFRPAQAQFDAQLEDSQLQAARANGVRGESAKLAALEPDVLQTSGQRASRNGADLVLRLLNGQQIVLQSHPECPVPISDKSCFSLHLIADLPSRHAFLIFVGLYEGADFWLIDDRTGAKAVLPTPPSFAPGSDRFITIDNSEAYGDGDIKIWDRHNDTWTVVWHHGLDQDPFHHLTNLVIWGEPDRITLDLSSRANLAAPETHWPATIQWSNNEWHFKCTWPKF